MRAKQLRRRWRTWRRKVSTQVFRPVIGADWIVGVVGPLQLDVLAARIEQEYRLRIDFEPVAYETARWVSAANPQLLKQFVDTNRSVVSEDRDGAPVFLARNNWELNRMMENWPQLQFIATKERL